MISPYSLFPDLLAPRYLGWLVDGLCMTLRLSLLVAVLSTLLGFVLAVARSSRRQALSLPASAYTALFRNTPLLVQLFFWYFGVPGLLPEGTIEWLNAPHELSLGG